MLIVYHVEDEAWWADSPDVAGFYAGDDTLGALRRRVRDALAFFQNRSVDEVDLDMVESFEDGSPVRQVLLSHQPAGGWQWVATSATAAVGVDWVRTAPRRHRIVADLGDRVDA